MNSNILIAFAAGAVIASGIVYVAVRPEDAVPLPAPVVVRSEAPVPIPVAQVDPAPAVVQPPAARESEAAAPAVPATPAPLREKPSPLRPPPVRRARPVVIARESEPSPMPAPQPAPIPDPPPQPVVTAPRAPAPQPEAPAPPPQMMPPTRTPNTVTIQPGTILAVRIGETISSVRNEVGDGFVATLERPLVIDGFVIAERGSRVEGRVVETQHPGRANGPSNLGVELVEISTSDGQRVRVRTATFKKESASSNGSDWANVVLTRGRPAEIPVETRMNFRIREPIAITERLQ